MTVLITQVGILTELDQLPTLSIRLINAPRVVSQGGLVGPQVLAYQLHVTVDCVGDLGVDVVRGPQQLQGRDLAMKQLQSFSCTVLVSGGDLGGGGGVMLRGVRLGDTQGA